MTYFIAMDGTNVIEATVTRETKAYYFFMYNGEERRKMKKSCYNSEARCYKEAFDKLEGFLVGEAYSTTGLYHFLTNYYETFPELLL